MAALAAVCERKREIYLYILYQKGCHIGSSNIQLVIVFSIQCTEPKLQDEVYILVQVSEGIAFDLMGRPIVFSVKNVEIRTHI